MQLLGGDEVADGPARERTEHDQLEPLIRRTPDDTGNRRSGTLCVGSSREIGNGIVATRCVAIGFAQTFPGAICGLRRGSSGTPVLRAVRQGWILHRRGSPGGECGT